MRELIDDSPDRLATFLNRWFGLPTTDPTDHNDLQDLPPALQEWFYTVRQWSAPIITSRTFYTPGEFANSDGKRIFLSDADGDWLWAYDPKTKDQPVFLRESPGDDWDLADETLRSFLLIGVATEVALRAPYSGWSWLATEEDIQRLTANMTEVPHKPLRWPLHHSRLHVNNDTLALVAPTVNMPPDQPTAFTVFLSGCDQDALDRADLPSDEHWFIRP